VTRIGVPTIRTVAAVVLLALLGALVGATIGYAVDILIFGGFVWIGDVGFEYSYLAPLLGVIVGPLVTLELFRGVASRPKSLQGVTRGVLENGSSLGPALLERIIEYEINSRTVFDDSIATAGLDVPLSDAQWGSIRGAYETHSPEVRPGFEDRERHWAALKPNPPQNP